MFELTINVVTTDFEHSEPLRQAITKEGLPLAQHPLTEPIIAVAVVDADPWGKARELQGANVRRILVFCTGMAEQRPAEPPAGAVVRHWPGDPETATIFVEQLFEQAKDEPAAPGPGSGGALAAAPEAAHPPDAPPPLLPPEPSPQRTEDEEPEVVDEAEFVEDAPPEPTPQGLMPPQRPTLSAAPVMEEITPEDRGFINRVFIQVKDVDFRRPPQLPSKSLTGIDKKMHFLRERVRELERDLARVGYVWATKQREVDAVEKIITSKESERQTAVQRYSQMKDQATRAAAAHRAEADDLKGRLAALESEKAKLQEDLATVGGKLAREEQEKAALIAEFRKKIDEAQTAFTLLREQSTNAIADLSGRLGTTQVELEQTQTALAEREMAAAGLTDTVAERDATIAQLQGELESARVDLTERRQDLERQHAELQETQQTVEARDNTVAEQTATIEERDQAIATLTDDNARAIDERDQQIAELHRTHEATVAEHTQAMETVRGEHLAALGERDQAAGDLRAEHAQAMETLREDHRVAIADLENTRAAFAAELEETRAAVAELQATLASVQDRAAVTQTQLDGRIVGLEEEVRSAHEQRLHTASTLADREKTLSAVTAEMSSSRQAQEERIVELKELMRMYEKRAADLDEEIKSARAEFNQIADEYQKHQANAGRISEELGQNLADARAEARIAKDRIAELEEALRDRDKQLNEALGNIDNAKEQAQGAQGDLEALQRQLEDFDKQNTELGERLRNAEIELTGLREESMTLRNDTEAFAIKLKDANESAEQAKSELATREASLMEAQAALQAAQEGERLARADLDAMGAQLTELQGNQS
ncbi:MAG: hypothetical protein A2289_08215 [Deltaproteobacteria bacterium RIFOXYA12_FULL_58_15]|nr:MAG: hypothetical protein A2289_08215 [Deltaproteobacteria bacterium RIFOXYA12_FULL_58_15]